MKKSVNAICSKCGANLDYKAVTTKKIKQRHKPGNVGAYCERCGAKLISK